MARAIAQIIDFRKHGLVDEVVSSASLSSDNTSASLKLQARAYYICSTYCSCFSRVSWFSERVQGLHAAMIVGHFDANVPLIVVHYAPQGSRSGSGSLIATTRNHDLKRGVPASPSKVARTCQVPSTRQDPSSDFAFQMWPLKCVSHFMLFWWTTFFWCT